MAERLTEADVRAMLERSQTQMLAFAAAEETIASLAREVLALMGERDEARAALREVEWIGVYDGDDSCPICSQEKPHHSPDCRLARALGGG